MQFLRRSKQYEMANKYECMAYWIVLRRKAVIRFSFLAHFKLCALLFVIYVSPLAIFNKLYRCCFSDARLLGPQQENRFQYGVIAYGQEPIGALINYQFVNQIWYLQYSTNFSGPVKGEGYKKRQHV